MAIKLGFFGSPCYDLIHYTSRVLKNNDMEVLLMDHSDNHSLLYSIPVQDDYDGEVFDYRGVDFSTEIPTDINYNYDVVLAYFGTMSNEHFPVDYSFIITTAEISDINMSLNCIDNVHKTGFISEGEDKLFSTEENNIIAIGPCVRKRKKYISWQFDIPSKKVTAIDLDDINMELRYLCQFNNNFTFNKISEDFKELISDLCRISIEDDINERTLRKNFKLAERGK